MNSETLQIRQEVKDFAEAMEMVLKENDGKRNWKDCSREYHESRLIEETGEYFHLKSHDLITSDISKAQKEIVDIANFCMMVFDKLETEKQNLPKGALLLP